MNHILTVLVSVPGYERCQVWLPVLCFCHSCLKLGDLPHWLGMGAVVRWPCRRLASIGPKAARLPLALQKQQVPTCPRSEKKGQEETAHTVSKLTHILKDQCCITQVFHGCKHCLVPEVGSIHCKPLQGNCQSKTFEVLLWLLVRNRHIYIVSGVGMSWKLPF